MFSKILIANRGEIACRIIDTCRKLGVKTVAIYSEIDEGARHVTMADEAVLIGGAAVADSYLQANRIIETAQKFGAEAIHPGFGFLSENPEFVEAVEDANLIFIGPKASSMRAMGLKDAAKHLMEKSGVPVVPGYHGDQQSLGFLAREAEKIGYPVLIKARAGGGGKGMRKVETSDAFQTALESAKREAEASFGDGHVLIEKYINAPRHIEVQVFGDTHGEVVHLYERDCSLQRRHQKVIEEAPAPGMTVELRAAMTEAAIKAAKAVDYEGAGTVEFIVDGSRMTPDSFYFMEMNTRLQVEHPVTEAVTGVDLVEWQLRVAKGEALPLKQEAIILKGHAFEARLYAEDPAHEFLPETGTLDVLRFPDAARIETGVRQGDAITPFYDPMIAKIITHGLDRKIALSNMQEALRDTRLLGCVTNLSFLSALANHPGFAKGQVDTGMIERDFSLLVRKPVATRDHYAGVALHLFGALEKTQGLGTWQLWGAPSRLLEMRCESETLTIRVMKIGAKRFRMAWDNVVDEVDLVSVQEGVFQLDRHGVLSEGEVIRLGHSIHVIVEDEVVCFSVGQRHHGREDLASNVVAAPMPGSVTVLSVEVGEKVEKGQVLAVMEAMKMEYALEAAMDGIVMGLDAAVGDQVEKGAALITLEALHE